MSWMPLNPKPLAHRMGDNATDELPRSRLPSGKSSNPSTPTEMTTELKGTGLQSNIWLSALISDSGTPDERFVKFES
jgi:hypothetical protein